MARLNEILVGRFNKSLQRVFGIKGGPPVATLAPEIMPVHIVPNGQEIRYLEGWNKYGTGVTLVALAANFGAFQIRNPTGSNVIIVVEQFYMSINGGAAGPFELRYGQVATDLGAPVFGQALDGRNKAKSVAATSTSNSTGSGLGNIVGFWNALANVRIDWINKITDEIVLSPGDALLMEQETANQATTFGAVWRERYQEESERI